MSIRSRRDFRCPAHSAKAVLTFAIGVALASALSIITAGEAEAARFGGFSASRMPRMSAPRMGPSRSFGMPRGPAINRAPRMTAPKPSKPPVGTIKKPTLPSPANASKLAPKPTALPKDLKNAPTAASKAAAAPKSDRYGWSDCHSRGGVWGANSSCGHPTFSGAGGSGPTGSVPRLSPIPWFVPILPTTYVAALPCPQGYEKIGETFYGGTKCQPVGSALGLPDYRDAPAPAPARDGIRYGGPPSGGSVSFAEPTGPFPARGAEIGIRPGIQQPDDKDRKVAKHDPEQEDPCKKDKNEPTCFCKQNPDAPICKTGDYCRSHPDDPSCLGSDVKTALSEIESGAPRPNVRQPKPFENDGRGGDPKLPEVDAHGNPIKYTEHTVNPRPPGGKLDGKRIVTGSDGSVWYTSEHFQSWSQIK